MITKELMENLFINNVTEISFPREKEKPIREKIVYKYRGKDKWAITDGGSNCWNKVTEEWEWEIRPSERTKIFLLQCRCNFEEGLKIIKELIAQKSVGGRKND